MYKNIAIIGGDQRIVELVKLMTEDDFNIYTYGLEQEKTLNTTKCNSIKELLDKNCKLVIGPIPFSRDNSTILAPFSKQEIYIDEFIKHMNKNSIFIAGNISQAVKEMFNRISAISVDILEREELTILNAAATAEGAIQIAMQETNTTLHGSEVLVLGFGRIGKILSKMLDGIGAKVYCEARKNSDIAWIKAYGYNSVHLSNLNKYLGKANIIFNTVPYEILDKQRLELVNKDCVIIDVASNPGGTDFEKAKELGINARLELGLPGRVAPKTSASYIKNTIDNIIQEIF